MEIKVKITKILEVQSGTSTKGEWKKVTFIGTTEEEYNNLYAFDVFGAEKVDNFMKYQKVGQIVDVKFNIQTNEWKEKYYTSLQAWSVFGSKDEQTPEPTPAVEEETDLPF